MHAIETDTTKETRSFSLERSVVRAIEKTKGTQSVSQRVNNLLKYALQLEQRAQLHEEIAHFFTGNTPDREERAAFQSATVKSLTRDEE
jgi:hypothetical protein